MRIKSLKQVLAILGLVSLFTLSTYNVALAQGDEDSSAAPAEEMAAEASADAGTWPPKDETLVKQGKELFNSKCNSCHDLNKKGTGPALSGVTDRREQDWLYKWVRNNEELRKSGDPEAIAIYEEYAGAAMNIFANIKNEEIDAIMAYTKYPELAAPAGQIMDQGPVAEVDPALAKRVNTVLLVIGFFILLIVILILEILNFVTRLTGKEIIRWNTVNAVLMLLFVIGGMAAAFWELYIHGPLLLPEASSEHGVLIDEMFWITFVLTGIVFVITQILLFGYAYVYRKRKGHKAFYYPHNNRLEVIWTVIPAIALTVLVLYGLSSWDSIMNPEESDEVQEFEIFAYQFGWKARMAGNDGELGEFNYNLISGTNPLGLGIREEYNKLQSEDIPSDIKALKEKIAEYEALPALTDEEAEKLADARELLHLKTRHLARLGDISNDTALFEKTGYDDYILDEIHLMVNKPVHFIFRARDVIHSAYMPYFRMQMNCVPGMPTEFTFTPTKSTKDMQADKDDPEWNYYLFCAKICGSAHYNMKMKVIVHDENDVDAYNEWKNGLSGYFAKYTETEEEATPTAEEQPEADSTTNAVALVK